jgi:hypothetical protein
MLLQKIGLAVCKAMLSVKEQPNARDSWALEYLIYQEMKTVSSHKTALRHKGGLGTQISRNVACRA